VETGNAVAVVRDTHFSVRVADDTTLVSVAEGTVRVTSQEQVAIVKAGEQVTVEGDRPPSLPEPMSDEERTLWATEGQLPELAPPTPTPTPVPPAPVPPTAVSSDLQE
jgi:ferric-dicitrate binding protein FerR (iron transport regulator)